MLSNAKMYKIMKEAEATINEAELPTTLVNTVIFLNRLGYLADKNHCNDILHKCAVCGDDADGPFYCPEHKS